MTYSYNFLQHITFFMTIDYDFILLQLVENKINDGQELHLEQHVLLFVLLCFKTA